MSGILLNLPEYWPIPWYQVNLPHPNGQITTVLRHHASMTQETAASGEAGRRASCSASKAAEA